jgi:hypothetical protein
MKSKTLAIITATLITAAALILTASLSLLNGAAIDISDAFVSTAEPVIDNGIADDNVEIEVEVEDTNDVEIDNDVDEEIYVETEEDVTVENEAPVEYLDTTLPALDTLEVVATSDELGTDHPGFEYVLRKDIVIDVFEHKTGKFVGQVWLTEDELYDEFCRTFDADFDYTAGLFDPNNPDDVPVYIPEATYRVEFYWVNRLTASASGCIGSLAFSYGVEDNEIYEFTQTGYSLANGETVIAFMESLVAEKIAQLENGVNDDLTVDQSFAYIIGFDGENSCWNGTTLSTGEFLPGAPRYAERFPYIQE